MKEWKRIVSVYKIIKILKLAFNVGLRVVPIKPIQKRQNSILSATGQ